jgi:hypothetical protein
MKRPVAAAWLAPGAPVRPSGGVTMTIQHDKPRLLSVGMIALVSAVALVAAVGAVLYRSVASGSRAKITARSLQPAEATFESREPPRVVQAAAPMTVPAAAKTASKAASLEQPETADNNLPFIAARQERRDSVWALQTESGVRGALAALRDKKVALESVQCASVRCTLEGTVGQGGTLHDVVSALYKVGLSRGRFKRVRGDDGTTTFSAVFARHGYNLDGSPKEVAAKAL